VRTSVSAGKGEEVGRRSVGWDGRGCGRPGRQQVGKEVDGIDEVALGGQHHKVDGVEVFPATEAAAFLITHYSVSAVLL